jgi:hypothetical protein
MFGNGSMNIDRQRAIQIKFGISFLAIRRSKHIDALVV